TSSPNRPPSAELCLYLSKTPPNRRQYFSGAGPSFFLSLHEQTVNRRSHTAGLPPPNQTLYLAVSSCTPCSHSCTQRLSCRIPRYIYHPANVLRAVYVHGAVAAEIQVLARQRPAHVYVT